MAWQKGVSVSDRTNRGIVGSIRCDGSRLVTERQELRGLTMVVPQHPAESLAAVNGTVATAAAFFGVDQPIVQPLVVPLPVLMGEIFGDRSAQ